MSAGSRLVAYVGSYAAPGAAAGIRRFELDAGTGGLTEVDAVLPELEAGFLAISADRRVLYAVDERKSDGRGPVGPPPSVWALAIDPADGRLTPLNSQRAFGPFPTYVDVDPAGRWVLTASHGSFEHVERVIRTGSGFDVEHLFDDSTVALYPVAPDGRLDPVCDVQILVGHGADPSRSPQVGHHPQASPHAHSAAFDPAGRLIVVCDKATDRIYLYGIDPAAARLALRHVHQCPLGLAPRHPAFHPTQPWLFVTNEMASSVSSFRYGHDGGLTHLATVPSTRAPDPCPDNAPADIQVHPSGRFLCVNNRGEDSVVVFAIDPGSGELTQAGGHWLAASAHPGVGARSLCFDPAGRYLLVADRPAGVVLSLRFDDRTGSLTAVGATPVPQPGFVIAAALGP